MYNDAKSDLESNLKEDSLEDWELADRYNTKLEKFLEENNDRILYHNILKSYFNIPEIVRLLKCLDTEQRKSALEILASGIEPFQVLFQVLYPHGFPGEVQENYIHKKKEEDVQLGDIK